MFYGVAQLPDAMLLTDFHGDVPQSVKDAVAAADKGLKDGSIKPPARFRRRSTVRGRAPVRPRTMPAA